MQSTAFIQAKARVKAPLDEVESYSGFFTSDDAAGKINPFHPGGNPGANLPQMPPDSGGICMGVD